MAKNTSATQYSPNYAVDNRGCLFTVMNPNEPLPPAFKLKAADAQSRAIIRIGGGCKGISAAAQEGMVPYFVEAFKGFAGVAFSGGTVNRDQSGQLMADMVTNIPAVLAHHFSCIALSTTPRTDDMFVDRLRAGVAIGDQALDIRQHAIAVVQVSAAQKAQAWDLDLPVYFDFMENLAEQGWKAALIALNGGEITRDEIYGALRRGIAVIVVEGSLRESDAFVKAFRDGDWSYTAAEFKAKQLAKGTPAQAVEQKVAAIVADCKDVLSKTDRKLVSIVQLNDAKGLRTVLQQRGLV